MGGEINFEDITSSFQINGFPQHVGCGEERTASNAKHQNATTLCFQQIHKP